MFKAGVLYPKVINKYANLNRPPFVLPQSRDGGRFVVSLSFKAFAEEVISQNTSLWQTITSKADFKVYPAVSVSILEGCIPQ